MIVRGKRSVATATHTPLLIVIWLFSDCHITLPYNLIVAWLRAESSAYG